ncbi:unnamed protein product [Rhizophagus irregularis]|nr:unnamed protein product [Rhizophagus irregularis]
MTLKLIEVKKNITKTGVRRWFHRQQFRARELAMDEADRNFNACHNGASQNNSDKPKLTLNLASKRRAALMTQLKTDEDFDDEEGIESKRKRRILVPSIEYSDNEDDENKTEEKEN